MHYKTMMSFLDCMKPQKDYKRKGLKLKKTTAFRCNAPSSEYKSVTRIRKRSLCEDIFSLSVSSFAHACARFVVDCTIFCFSETNLLLQQTLRARKNRKRRDLQMFPQQHFFFRGHANRTLWLPFGMSLILTHKQSILMRSSGKIRK